MANVQYMKDELFWISLISLNNTIVVKLFFKMLNQALLKVKVEGLVVALVNVFGLIPKEKKKDFS